MKASIVSLVFTAALAAAQDLSGLPSCATGCVTKFTTGTAIGGCQQLDIGCICKNADFLNGIACCLAGACSQSDQDKAVSFAQQICSSAGVTTPDTVVCKDSSSSQTGSATASDSSATASGNSASSKTTDSSDSSTTGSSDSSSTATDSSSAPSSTDSGSTTTAPTGSSAHSTTGSATKSAATTTSSNVAAPLASAGSLVGAAIAMLAAAL